MFEYTKTVLKKVSFNSDLFYIELEKALKRLLPYEVEELTIWIKQLVHRQFMYHFIQLGYMKKSQRKMNLKLIIEQFQIYRKYCLVYNKYLTFATLK